MLHPFTYDSITIKTKDLIDLQSGFGMNALLEKTPYNDFWVNVLNAPEYRIIAKKAIFVFIQIPTKYSYAKVFFLVCVRSNLAKEVHSHTLIH